MNVLKHILNIIIQEQVSIHNMKSLGLSKNLNLHDSANLTGQRPAKFFEPSDFF